MLQYIDQKAHIKNLMRIAVNKGNLKIIQLLDEFVVDVEDSKDRTIYPYMRAKDDLHPFHLAAKQGHQEVIEFLLQKNADPDLLDLNEMAPVHLGVQQGN